MRYRVGLLTTHPIQYQVPWFRSLAKEPELDLTVFYGMLPDARQQGDGFGVAFQWDVPLLTGYPYEVLKNVSRRPSVTAFRGCDTPSLGQVVRERAFDAFIVNGWVVKSCLQLLWACRRYGVPCIVRGESNVLRRRPWWARTAHRLLLRNYAACLYIGEANRAFYRRNGVAEERLFPGLYCVENERFSKQADALRPERARIRSEWGIPGSACVFLFCAKFAAKKHPLDLLHALARARRGAGEGSPLRVLMVGDGELKAECERLAVADGLPVTFAGFLNQSEIARAYVAADCLVLPSDAGETWGLVVNEAMACGLPAIVSDLVGCAADLVRPGETGAVFPCGDIAALAALLQEFGQEPARLKAMGERARLLVAGYSADAVAKGTVAAVVYACSRRRRGNDTRPAGVSPQPGPR